MPRSVVPPEAPRTTSEVSISTLAHGRFEVSFAGPLRLGWLARLAAALSVRHVAIDRAHAERSPDGTWTARMELRPGVGSPDILDVDFLALTDENPGVASNLSKPHLSTYRLSRTPARLLELVLTAPDEVGFLSALFARLGFWGLFPERILATTRAGRIDDTLILRGIGGEPPSLATEESLRAALARLCFPPVGSGSSPPAGGSAPPSAGASSVKVPSSSPPGSKSSGPPPTSSKSNG